MAKIYSVNFKELQDFLMIEKFATELKVELNSIKELSELKMRKMEKVKVLAGNIKKLRENANNTRYEISDEIKEVIKEIKW